MRTVLVLVASLAVSSLAAAEPPAGRYQYMLNTEYPGFAWFAPTKDGRVCGLYLNDDNSGGELTLKASGTDYTGVWEEGTTKGKAKLSLVGKTMKGGYTETTNDEDNDLRPWDGTLQGVQKASWAGTFQVDWADGVEKTTITFAQSGAKVTGTVVYRNSKSAAGHVTATAYGDFVFGTWTDRDDDGKPREGYFSAALVKHPITGKLDVLKGFYASDLTSCGNGGTLRGSRGSK